MDKNNSIGNRLLIVFGILVWFIPSTKASFNLSLIADYEKILQGLEGGNVIKDVFKDVIDGPFKEQRVTVVIPQDYPLEPAVNFDTWLLLPQSPLSILRLPMENPEGYGDESDLSSSNDSYSGSGMNDIVIREDIYGVQSQGFQLINSTFDPIYYPDKTDVVIMIIPPNLPFWWPLWQPSKNWVTTSILLVSISTCGATHHLASPLMEKTQFVALLCPDIPRGTGGKTSIRVKSFLPFAPAPNLLDLGEWDPDVFKDWSSVFVDRFRDMKGKNISVKAIKEDVPLVYATKDGKPRGLNVHILWALSRWLGFRLILDLTAGELWEEMAFLVRDGLRDVMINFSTSTPQRYRDYDLSVAYHYEGFGLVLQLPQPLPRWQNILHPFTWTVWAASLASLVVTAIAYHSLYRAYESSLIANSITIAQSFLSHPLEKIPKQWKIRSFLLHWWVGSWLLELSWICNLVAFLTIPVFHKQIQTKKELAESSYRLCLLDYGDFVSEALKVTNETVLAILGSKLDTVPLMMSLPEFGDELCVDMVLAGTHAHSGPYSYIKQVYERMGHSSTTYMMREHLYPSYLTFRFRKNTPWKYKFDDGIQRLYEVGLVQYWLDRVTDDFRNYSRLMSGTSGFRGQAALTTEHLEGPFFILLIGLALASAVLAGETVS